MLDSGYTFVQPNDIYPGLRPEPHQKLALITFDDGYYNNTHLIPVLEEFEVPALFLCPQHTYIMVRNFGLMPYTRPDANSSAATKKYSEKSSALNRYDWNKLKTSYARNLAPPYWTKAMTSADL